MEKMLLKEWIMKTAGENIGKWKSYNSFVLFEGKNEQLKMINEAFALLSDSQECLDITVALLDLWCKGTDDEVRDVFGDCVNLRPAFNNAMFTLTGDCQQLRVWFSFPGGISYNHVDSCGKNLLFGVYGHPDFVQVYLIAFLDVVSLAEAKGKNGARIFVGH